MQWLDEVDCESDHKGAWSTILAQLSDNFPQHIMSCVAAVRDYLAEHGSNPTTQALEAVRDAVERYKREYYGLRASGGPEDALTLLGMLIGGAGMGQEFDHDQLIDVLRFRGREATPSASHCLSALVSQGVQADRLNGGHYVPIPSMARYLVEPAVGRAIAKPGKARRFWQWVKKAVIDTYNLVDEDFQRQIESSLESGGKPRHLSVGFGSDEGALSRGS